MTEYTKRRPLLTTEKDALPGYSELLQHLLFHRGVTESAAAEKFLMPEYTRDTHDPMLLKDADKAAARIIHAIETGERIAIYSDYDCDGVPGGAMFHDLFTRIGYKNFMNYIPHRHNEGFGVHKEALDTLAADGVKLVVTLDCGITDVESVDYANSLGMEVIITDHHEPPAELPRAFAIVDPKQSDCAYPDKFLCGTGVGYKLILAILGKNRFGMKEGHEKWLLDLVGIATLSDMVPLTGENRVFASYGLQVLRKTKRKGLERLFKKLKMQQAHLTEDDIAFMVTPRINAASRMGVPMDAFKMLVADTDESADVAVEHLDGINNERKGVVASLVKEVKKIVRERHVSGEIPRVIVLGNPEWRPSLLGLAANSCAEEFRRPVFLWGRDGEGEIKGSCRTDGITNIVELMRAVPAGTFGEFGGHKQAGGFGVNGEAIHRLEILLNEAAEKLAQAKTLASGGSGDAGGVESDPDKVVDHELSMDDVGFRLADDLNRLAPFGVGNSKPIFLFRKVSPAAVKKFGKANEHIEISFKKSNGERVAAISFFGAGSGWAEKVGVDKPLDLIASIEKSNFRGRSEIRLRIADVIYS